MTGDPLTCRPTGRLRRNWTPRSSDYDRVISMRAKAKLRSPAYGAVLCAAIALVVADSTSARAEQSVGSGTRVLVPTPAELPGWRPGPSQAQVSGDLIHNQLDRAYPEPTANRIADGWVATYHRTHTGLNSFAAVTRSPAAARLAVKHFAASLPSQGFAARRIAIGDGGVIGGTGTKPGALATTTGITWSSGRYVMSVFAQTQGPKPAVSETQLAQLARRVQSRIRTAG